MVEANTKVTGIDATYYYVKDLGRATDFYKELLGMEPTMAFEGMVAEWTLADGGTFGLYKSETDMPSCHGVMFAVPDVREALSEHKARGVKFNGEIEDTPVCHMAFGEDSEGNTFILHHRK